MIKTYFNRIKRKEFEINKTQLKNTMTKKIAKEFDLNIKTDNFLHNDMDNEFMQA